MTAGRASKTDFDLQKRAYFTSLPQSHLVSLLCYATTAYPSLPFFHQDTQARLEALGIDTTGRSVSTNAGKTSGSAHIYRAGGASATASQFLADPDEETEEDKWATDPTAINFPRPGYGLLSRMPPEADDLPWLVDDNLEVFSHIYHKGDDISENVVAGAMEDMLVDP